MEDEKTTTITTTTKGRKRSRYAYRKGKRGNLVSYVMGAPVPTKFGTIFRYRDYVRLNPTGGTAVHVFRNNSCYDVDITGTGHQPRGFDELMAMYDHGVVIGCRIVCDFVSDNETNNAMVGVAVRDQTSAGDVTSYMEGHAVKFTSLGRSNGFRARITYNVNPNKFLGRSKPLSDPNLKFSASGNSTEGCFYHIFVSSFDGTQSLDVDVNVWLEYIVVLIEPKQPPLS